MLPQFIPRPTRSWSFRRARMGANLDTVRSAADEHDAHLLRLANLFLFQVKALAEPLDPASAVKDALLARKERVAIRADIHAHILLHAASLKRISTSARHCGFNKVRVDSSFHRYFSRSFRRIDLWLKNGCS